MTEGMILIFTLDVSIKISYTIPSGPFLFFAIKILPVLFCLSSIVRETEKIKSATKHLLKASVMKLLVLQEYKSEKELILLMLKMQRSVKTMVTILLLMSILVALISTLQLKLNYWILPVIEYQHALQVQQKQFHQQTQPHK